MLEPNATGGRPGLTRPLALAAGAAVVAALVPLVPADYRVFNFALVGAVGLFAAGRCGLLPGLLLCLGAKFLADAFEYRQSGYDLDHLPFVSVYVGFAFYPLVGYWLARRPAKWRVGLAGLLGGVPFFLITNFASWQAAALPYDRGPAGLLESYLAALPFHRATVVSDVLFTGLLFATDAALARVLRPVVAEART